jgi:tetratricopeptide (TPR) repeat protein
MTADGQAVSNKPLWSRPPIILAMLTLSAVVGFIVVGRLINLYRQHQRDMASHFYQLGAREQKGGSPQRAAEDFRAALMFDPDNDQIQLSLGRALSDTGQLGEAQAYLSTLWERSPQDSSINLALARLAARQGNLDDAVRYYHNAIYGVWTSDPDTNRRQTRFELIEFLLHRHAYALAQSELIALAPLLPPDPQLHLRAAAIFAEIQDYVSALAEYQTALRKDPQNHAALLGAGEAAFELGQYRTAHKYLQAAVNGSPSDAHARQLLETASLILASDPYRHGISDAERNRRIEAAFNQAGQRLDFCAQKSGIDLSGDRSGTTASADLASLKSQWLQMKPRLRHMNRQPESDLPNAAMDMVSQIEQRTAKQCGNPEGLDLALLLISRDQAGVDR